MRLLRFLDSITVKMIFYGSLFDILLNLSTYEEFKKNCLSFKSNMAYKIIQTILQFHRFLLIKWIIH
jgi:hypothetical protein